MIIINQTLEFADYADILVNGKEEYIAATSPMGFALMGKKVGDKINVGVGMTDDSFEVKILQIYKKEN